MHMPLYVSPAPVSAADLNAAGPISVAAVLNAVLAECFALYLKTRSCQMQMQGTDVETYRTLLDKQADALFRTTEAIAERVGQTGASDLFAINIIASASTIGAGSARQSSPPAILSELRDDNVALVEILWQAKAVIDKAADHMSSRLVDTWIDEAEDRAWLLFGATWE
jgi:starvation-inducible DNA-binding protein